MTLKPIPCWAAHTCLGQIRECPPAPGYKYEPVSPGGFGDENGVKKESGGMRLVCNVVTGIEMS